MVDYNRRIGREGGVHVYVFACLCVCMGVCMYDVCMYFCVCLCKDRGGIVGLQVHMHCTRNCKIFPKHCLYQNMLNYLEKCFQAMLQTPFFSQHAWLKWMEWSLDEQRVWGAQQHEDLHFLHHEGVTGIIVFKNGHWK